MKKLLMLLSFLLLFGCDDSKDAKLLMDTDGKFYYSEHVFGAVYKIHNVKKIGDYNVITTDKGNFYFEFHKVRDKENSK